MKQKHNVKVEGLDIEISTGPLQASRVVLSPSALAKLNSSFQPLPRPHSALAKISSLSLWTTARNSPQVVNSLVATLSVKVSLQKRKFSHLAYVTALFVRSFPRAL